MVTGQERDYYLKTLGVIQYVPREFCLPETVAEVTAAPPEVNPEIAQVEPAQPPVQDARELLAEQPVENRAESPEEKPVPQPIEKQPVEIEQAATVTAEPAVKAKPVDTEEPQRFRICYWRVADLLVFDSLDYGQNPPQDRHELLANILQSIGRSGSPLPEPELLDWPLVPNARADNAGARAMFSTFLKRRVEQDNVQWVLVMGECASNYLLSNLVNVKGKMALSGDCQAIRLPGLAEMLEDPNHKRTAWQAIRFLAESTQ
ncbi:hypothetical protein QP938_04190 [Porticoccaceae bacterium LTM1]|nr:hypothetical protein QP938_04190 [Porticoccaceae bacterium LTM1]